MTLPRKRFQRDRVKVKVAMTNFKKNCVISLALLFIIRFYFTKMFSMTISWSSLSLSVLGPRSRSQWLLLEKHCHRSTALIYYPISIYLHISSGYDIPRTSSHFSMIGSRSQWLFLEKLCNWKLVRLQRENNLTRSSIFITREITIYMTTKLFNSFKNSFCLLRK